MSIAAADIDSLVAGRLYAGVDEVGRGPLAGPVVAAAVILDPQRPVDGLKDSKKLSERRRESLDALIRERALCWSLGRAEVEEIDRINILQASLLAMKRAVDGLQVQPQLALVDGVHPPPLACAVENIVKGDALVAAISAASIVAKVARDREMQALDSQYPGYGLASHKGYPSKAHLEALRRLGVAAVHRRSYAPVRRLIQESEG